MHHAPTTADRVADERCACGNLVAKVTLDGVEILCRRCKRVHRIPWQQIETQHHMRDGPAAHITH